MPRARTAGRTILTPGFTRLLGCATLALLFAAAAQPKKLHFELTPAK